MNAILNGRCLFVNLRLFLIFSNNFMENKKGKRGRPTLEAKRQAELHPIQTLKGFWTEHFDLLRGRFELLDKEKPTMLIDNANNLDAFSNLFLGIRLLH